MKLTTGQQYDLESLRETFTGWSDGGENEGMTLDYFFDSDGAYKGADEDGVEPEFA